MKVLPEEDYHASLQFIIKEGRTLEKMKAKHLLHGEREEEIIRALASYQNEDGGFGHGLEPDFRLPASSPLATSVALQTLIHHDHLPSARIMIKEAIRYLERSFHADRSGWYAVPPEVNDYPHAFWWTVHENGMSWIDAHWGNPSAEIIGYLLRYKNMVTELPIDELERIALNHLMNLQTFESEHEIYCYLRFFRLHPELRSPTIDEQLERAVKQQIRYDQEAWKDYVPSPMKFIQHPGESLLGIPVEEINKNLDFLADRLKESHCIEPTWEWNDYKEDWEKAKMEWSAILTLEAIDQLRSYERIQKD
ncbi:hypothetical protein [Thalassobacillus hwangdonensis]|uniref:Prenyltransferase n=1 Tax=Thalassobacillus hwangdonensis TaxID=546108 RepID=A0ABW3L1P9_9BACI